MNWVEEEFAALKAVEPDPDAWLSCYQSGPASSAPAVECEHRWRVRPRSLRVQHGSIAQSLPMESVCRCCGAEA